MRSRIGITCMVLGTVLILAALSLFIWNQRENEAAGIYAEEMLSRLMEQIEMQNADASEEGSGCPDPYDPSMTEAEIDGCTYIGYLSIPVIELELPVMSEWDYDRLKLSPCRYFGSVKTDDLVICAHNYARHFGPIRNLEPGDAVYFTDMSGVVRQYEVSAVDILPPTDVENMTAGDYDLTLFTCTYGGQSRLAVRCQSSTSGGGAADFLK